jgi:hypothetical protein
MRKHSGQRPRCKNKINIKKSTYGESSDIKMKRTRRLGILITIFLCTESAVSRTRRHPSDAHLSLNRRRFNENAKCTTTTKNEGFLSLRRDMGKKRKQKRTTNTLMLPTCLVTFKN